MKRRATAILLGTLVIAATGCATPARVDQMSVSGQSQQRVVSTPLRNNLAIKDVTGGKETNPMWTSQVGSSEFEQALETSLRAVGLLADRQAGKYLLTADLEGLDQPFIGIDMTVSAKVSYSVAERSTGKEVLRKTLVTPYTARIGDAFYGPERLKLANEGAVRENITKLIDELLALRLEGVEIK